MAVLPTWVMTSSSRSPALAPGPWGLTSAMTAPFSTWTTWAGVCPKGLHRLSTGTAHSPRGTRQQPFSTPRFQPSPSARPLSRLYAEHVLIAGHRPHAMRLDLTHRAQAPQLRVVGGGIRENCG